MFGKLFGGRQRGLTKPDFAEGDVHGFWRWYSANGETFRQVGLNARKGAAVPAETIAAMGQALARIHPELAFEMGIDGEARHEIVISAEGVLALFPEVIALTSAAPPMTGHKVTAFRQRSGGVVTMFGRSVAPGDVLYAAGLDAETGHLDVVLYLPLPPEFDERQRAQLGFLVLDCVLGEYDVATSLGGIDFASSADAPGHDLKRLPELAAEVDAINRTRPRQ